MRCETASAQARAFSALAFTNQIGLLYLNHLVTICFLSFYHNIVGEIVFTHRWFENSFPKNRQKKERRHGNLNVLSSPSLKFNQLFGKLEHTVLVV